MTELGGAIRAHAAKAASTAAKTVQLATVTDADPLTLEMTESRHVLHDDQFILSQLVKQYDAGDGIQVDDVLVLIRKATNGTVTWYATDVVSDADSPGVSGRVSALEAAMAVAQGQITALQAATAASYDVAIPAATNWTSTASYSVIGRLYVLQGFFSKTGGTGTPAANDVMGTMPVGARPLVQLNPPALTQNGDVVGSYILTTAGQFLWRTGSTAETDQMHIDGLTYVV